MSLLSLPLAFQACCFPGLYSPRLVWASLQCWNNQNKEAASFWYSFALNCVFWRRSRVSQRGMSQGWSVQVWGGAWTASARKAACLVPNHAQQQRAQLPRCLWLAWAHRDAGVHPAIHTGVCWRHIMYGCVFEARWIDRLLVWLLQQCD